MKMKDLGQLAWWFMVLGALNLGVAALLNLNLVELVLGSWPVLVRVVYVLVGLSAVYYLLNMGGKKK